MADLPRFAKMTDDFRDFVKFDGFAGQVWYHQMIRDKRILRRAREFTPERLLEKGEQGVWYDPSDTTTLFQDSAGTTPVTASGQPVGLMLDKSGRGNHATQPTAASRPIYRRGDSRGVVNRLTWSEDFDNALWGKGAAGTGSIPVVNPNDGIAPDGTMTADAITFNAPVSGDQSTLIQNTTTVIPTVYTGTVWLKAKTPTDVGKIVLLRHVGAASFTQITLTADWARVVRVETAVSTTGSYTLALRPASGSSTGQVSCHIWGAQLNLSPTALPYQRNDGNLGGVATGSSTDLHWLETDGVDDGMVTGSIDFTGTDKVSVFAGVRKLSDAATGVVVELSANSNNQDAFAFTVPDGANTNIAMSVRGVGNLFNTAVFNAGASPNSVVVSSIADRGLASNEVIYIRNNGIDQPLSRPSNHNTLGNFGNYPLYLFRRAGTTLPFNGWFYGLAITGRLTTDAETVATERYLAAKSAVVIP